MAVADAGPGNSVSQVVRQVTDIFTCKVRITIVERKAALLLGEPDRGAIGRIANAAHCRLGKPTTGIARIIEPEHHKRIGEPR